MIFSPQPRCSVAHMGPVFARQENVIQRKRESESIEFINGCLELIKNELRPDYYYILISPGVADMRPFIWNGFNVTPRYDYVVDIGRSPEQIMKDFKS